LLAIAIRHECSQTEVNLTRSILFDDELLTMSIASTWGWRRLRIVLIALMIACPLFPVASHAADDEIATLIEQLDSDEFAERDQAERKLIARGRTVLPKVMAARNSPSREIAGRCRSIFRQLHHQILLDEFRRLAALDDADIDLEFGMYLVTRAQEPLVERETISKQLDALAKEVTDELAVTIKGRTPTAPEQLAALRKILFVKHGFTGNEAQYSHPDNSSLTRVLATKRGLPLTLSHITIAVARRVGLTLQGVALSRRYIVWYDPPPGRAADEAILDPFDQGRLLSRDDLEDLLAGLGAGFDQMSDLKRATGRETIARALRNLRSHSDQFGQTALADDCQAYWAVFGLGE
jgi:regulator of sirC expression with transglutaminase-like and TPR domain